MSSLRPFVVINKKNTSAPLDHSAAVELSDIDRGFLPNRLTTVQRDAISAPATGLTIYNTDTNRLETWTSLSWTQDATTGALLSTNNLSDLANAVTARTNLGLGSAATHASTDFDIAGAAASVQAADLQKSANLSDLANAVTARTNLGLGSAATHASTDFNSSIVKLASGTIPVPVAYLDLTLPIGYVSFSLQLTGFLLSFGASDNLAFAISYDSGSTFLNDHVHFDSYVLGTNSGQGAALSETGTDSLGIVVPQWNDSTANQFPMMTTATIDPGSSTTFFQYTGYYTDFNTGLTLNGNPGGGGPVFNIPNRNSIITPTPGRVNLIRILPRGNRDSNPPTSSRRITTGTYILWGIAP